MTSFSVIITSHNYADYVVEAVSSALHQTRAPQQVIVVDDGSTDGSPELLQSRFSDDSRVTLLLCPNGGQMAAFKRGVDVAATDVVCFLDADDLWEPDYLEKIGKVFDERGDVDFVFSDLRLFGNAHGTKAFAGEAMDLGLTVISTYLGMHFYGAATSALAIRLPMAARCLDLPRQMFDTWRLCADTVLIHGTSMLCGRKYFLPTGSVRYRIHGKNGWGIDPSETDRLVLHLRSRAIVNHFAQRLGLDESSWRLLKSEFRTKPDPSRRERRRYVQLAMESAAPLHKRLELYFNLMRRKRPLASFASAGSAPKEQTGSKPEGTSRD